VWRRVVYVLIGIVTLNLVLMAVMFVQARNEDNCDTSAQGLVIWDDGRDHWMQISPPQKPTNLPPCKGRLESVLKVTPD
jgi:hypothetical protein